LTCLVASGPSQQYSNLGPRDTDLGG
jgi:hypothetical protein